MPGAELTPVQRFVLVTLMIKAVPLKNTYLTNDARITLKREYRDDLRDRGLIKVAEKPLTLELTEAGWAQAINELGGDVPARAGSAGGALYVTLEFLRALLDRLEVAPAELFTLRLGSIERKPDEPAADFETIIRTAYHEVAARAGDYIPLTEVRKAVRADVDSTLVKMYRADGVELIPNSQQGDLTEDDRAAAVKIGNQDRHLIAISS